MLWNVKYYEQTYTNVPTPTHDNFLGATSSNSLSFTKSCSLSDFSGSEPEGRKVYVVVTDQNGNKSLISNVISFTITPS